MSTFDMIKAISWNIAHRPRLWDDVLAQDADIVLLQEAPEPPANIAVIMRTDDQPWCTEGGNTRCNWRAATVALNPRVEAAGHEPKPIKHAEGGEFAVSRLGTLSAATITVQGLGPVEFISMYSRWEVPHASTNSNWIYAASVHRLISDLSVLIGRQRNHRIVAAGRVAVRGTCSNHSFF